MAGLLMALVGAGAAFTAIVYVPHAAISKSNFDRIRIGMTKKEADSILGRKNVLCVPNERNHLLPGFTEYEWVGDGEANTLH